MIEITLATASQCHPSLPLVVRQRRRRSLDEPQPTSPGHRRDTEPDLDASGKCCLATLSRSKQNSTVVPTARKRMLEVVKSP
jgi:hypothetical protein